MRASISQRTPVGTRAFSLVELIVVVVIVGILAGLIVPRVVGSSARRVRAAAEAAGEVLSLAARREGLSTQPMAIDYDAETSRLRILTLSQDSRGDLQWVEAGASLAAQLGDTRVSAATADSNQLDTKKFRVEFPSNTRRPALVMTLEDQFGRDPYTVALSPWASAASVTAGRTAPDTMDQSIDLDATGKGEQAW